MKKIITSSVLALAVGQNAFAAVPATTTYFGATWSGVGFVLGYGNEEAYVAYACNGTNPGTSAECDGPPRTGLIRKFTEIVDNVITALDIKTCAAVPTSGSKSVTANGGAVTVNFATPKQKIPAAWTGGGTAYDRRIEFNVTYASTLAIKVVVEASCTVEKNTMVAMNMLVGSNAAGYERPINLFVGTKDGKTVADVYTVEKNAAGNVRSAYVYNVNIDETAKTYQIAGAQTSHFDGTAKAGLDVFNVHGNFSTHAASVRMNRFIVDKENSSPNAVDTSNGISSMTGSDDALLSSSTTYALLTASSTSTNGPVGTSQGCMDFDTSTTAPTSNAACTGLDYLTSVPTPVIDATGKFSPKWMMQTAKSKLVEIPTL